jgi:hypothetical protein
MTISGEKVPAFSAITLNLPSLKHDYTEQIIEYSRSIYALNRNRVERDVGDRYFPPQEDTPKIEQKQSLPETKSLPKELAKEVERVLPKPSSDISDFEYNNEVKLR